MSQVRGTVEVKGLEETLRVLRKVEPDLVKKFRADARAIAKPAVESARGEFRWQAETRTMSQYQPDRPGGKTKNKPDMFPLSGMTRGNLVRGRAETKWNPRKAITGITFRIGGPAKKRRAGKFYRLFAVVQMNPAGAIFDMAGKHGGAFNPDKVFEESLESVQVPHRSTSGSGPSRYMWPAVEGQLPNMENEMRMLIFQLEARINKKLLR